jgi:hypothetical protein
VRPRSAALAVAVAAAAIGAGPVTGALASPSASAGGRVTPAVTNPGDAEPSLSLATGTNGAPKAAADGAKGSLWYYTVAKGHWHATRLGGSGTAYSGPSVVSGPGGNAAVAVEGKNHSLLLFVTKGSKWVKLTVAGKNTAYSVPSLALGPSNAIGIAVEGKSNSLWYYWLAGGKFHSHEVLSAAYIYSSPSLVIRDAAQGVPGDPAGSPDIAVEAGGHALYYLNSVHGKWHNTLVPGSNGMVYSAPALDLLARPWFDGGEAFVAVEGPHNSFAGFSSGRGWGPFGTQPLGSGWVYGAVSIIQNLQDSDLPIAVAYHGPSDLLGILFLNEGSATPGWQNDVITSKPDAPSTLENTFSAPAMAVQTAGPAAQVDVIFQGAHNTLWFYKGPKPASGIVPTFAGQRIGAPGSTFGG